VIALEVGRDVVYGLSFMVYRLWFIVYGLSFMVYRLWFVVYGLSFMEGSVETIGNATTIINSKLLTLN